MQVWEYLDSYLTRPAPLTAFSKPSFWPSEASVSFREDDGHQKVVGKCLRASFLRRVLENAVLQKQIPIDSEAVSSLSARSRYIFMMGNAIERQIQSRLIETGLWEGSNIKYYDEEHDISGEIDLLLRDPEQNVLFINEIKTIYGYYAKKEIIGSKTARGFPRWSNLLQLALYLDYFREDIPFGKLLYMCRDSVDRAEYEVRVRNPKADEVQRRLQVEGLDIDNFSMKDIYDRFRALGEHLKNGTMPPNDYVFAYEEDEIRKRYEKGEISKTKYKDWEKGKEWPGDWQCKGYCEFSRICWPQEMGQAQ